MKLILDLDQTRKFLKILSRGTPITYQTFSDKKKDKGEKDPLAKILHEKNGNREKCLQQLVTLNEKGAGVFWMVNQGDLKGRSTENVMAIRSVFVDLDENGKEKLVKVQEDSLEPNAIVETSPGKYHAYWLIEGLSLAEFETLQERLAEKFGGCNVKDLPRVTRLPGFNHLKGKPFLSRIVSLNEIMAPYPAENIKRLLPPVSSEKEKPKFEDELERILRGIPDGNRNDTLKSLVGYLVGKHLANPAIMLFLRAWDQKNTPPLGEKVLATCLKNIRKTDSKKPAVTGEFHLTDLGNAGRLVKAFGEDLRYCYRWKKWVHWDGRRWLKDEMGEIDRLAKAVVRLLLKEAFKLAEDDPSRKSFFHFVFGCESEGRLGAMVELAKSEPNIPISPDELDQDLWLLNMLNGTVDLRTGELRVHRREDHLTRMIPIEYQSNAECPFWIEHLKKIMGGKQDMIDFLQRCLGYSLTGITDERVLFIQYGEGANGKTTTNEVISRLMGDYALKTPKETLFVKRGGEIPNDVASLKGVRFAYCSEGEKGKRLAEALIKDMTGGNRLNARFLYSEPFTFQPTHKIWFETNHKPKIMGTDDAIWDRIRLVPFNVRIPEKERIPQRKMMAQFEKEFSGILTWMVKGCLAWQKDGLETPEEVKEATTEYRKEMDFLSDFIKARCVTDKGARVLFEDLYNELKEWLKETDFDIPSEKSFSISLERDGYQKRKITKGPNRFKREWSGIGLRYVPGF